MNVTILNEAVEQNYIEIVKALLTNPNIDVNCPSVLQIINFFYVIFNMEFLIIFQIIILIKF